MNLMSVHCSHTYDYPISVSFHTIRFGLFFSSRQRLAFIKLAVRHWKYWKLIIKNIRLAKRPQMQTSYYIEFILYLLPLLNFEL